jgi:hypothetical protein
LKNEKSKDCTGIIVLEFGTMAYAQTTQASIVGKVTGPEKYRRKK